MLTGLSHAMPQYLVEYYSWLCLWGCFRKMITWIGGQRPSPKWMGITQPAEAGRGNGRGKLNSYSWTAWDISILLPLDRKLCCWFSWFLELWSQTEVYTITCPDGSATRVFSLQTADHRDSQSIKITCINSFC